MNRHLYNALISTTKEISYRENKSPSHIAAIFPSKSGCITLITTLVIFILFGVLTFASWLTTATFGNSFLPSGQYLLYIENQAGKPIDGAILNVYIGDDQTPVDSEYFPLEAHSSKNGLKSNAKGIIIINHIPPNMEMDSDGWALFWVFPIINGNKNYNCEITANGYKSLRFPLDRLIEVVVRNPFPVQTAKVTSDNKDLKLNIYELRLVLQEQ